MLRLNGRQHETTTQQQFADAEAGHAVLADALDESEKSVADLTERLDDLATKYAQLQDPP